MQLLKKIGFVFVLMGIFWVSQSHLINYRESLQCCKIQFKTATTDTNPLILSTLFEQDREDDELCYKAINFPVQIYCTKHYSKALKRWNPFIYNSCRRVVFELIDLHPPVTT